MLAERTRKIIKVALPVLLALAAPVLFVCCTPGWSPDSKSFAFVTITGNLKVLNLETGEKRQIAQVSAGAVRPALLSDGRIACVVRSKSEGRLKVFSPKGETLLETEAFPDLDLEKATRPATESRPMVSCYASRDERRILVFVDHAAKAFVVDLKDKSLRKIDKIVAPTSYLGNPMPLFDVSPITPDGQGFLAIDVSEKRESGDIVYYSWKEDVEPVGFKYAFEMEDMAKIVAENEPGLSTIPSWVNGKLEARVQSQLIRLDVKTKQITLHEDMQSDVLNEYAKKNDVRVMMELADDTVLQFTLKGKLQIAKRRGEAVDLVNFGKEQMAGVFPSPDRKKVILRYFAENDSIRVINLQGETIAEVKPPK